MLDAGRNNRSTADLGGTRTAYIDRGAGPALVMVHGVGLNAAVWTPQIDEFAGAFRTIAYDTLGHGGSSLPPPGAALPDYVAQLRALLDCLGIDRTILLGHSMGALIATLFAIEHGTRVDGLIAANPVYRRSPAQLAAGLARLRRLEEHGPETTLDDVLSRWFGEAAEAAPEEVEQVRQWLRDADPQGYAQAYRVFYGADPWLANRMAELEVPALFVTGGRDPNSTPAMACAMAAEAPLGRAEIIEGQRHMMACAAPERFNPVVRAFLDAMPGVRTGGQRRAGRGP